MKRILFAMAAMLFMVAGVPAQNLKVSLNDFSIKAGESADLVVSLENAMSITGWDMKLFTPSGITTSKKKCVLPEDGRYAMNDDDELTHELNFSKLTVDEGNGYYLACYSMANEVITGNSGVIVTITLTADANFDGNGEIVISEFGVADTDNKSILLGSDVKVKLGASEDVTYTVAGSAAFFGTTWDPTNTANDMALGENSLYIKTYEDVELEAGNIEFKVVENHAWDVAYPAENYVLTIAKAGKYDVSITFNAETKEVKAEATAESVAINSMEIVGTFPGMSWNVGEGVAMIQDPDDAAIWSVTMEGVQVEGIKYEYKATANGKWGDYELPASGNNEFTFGTNEYPAGKYNLTFTVNTVENTLVLFADKQAEVQLFELLTLNGDAAYAKDMFFLIEAANEASATIVLKAGDTELSEIMEDGSVFIQIPNAAFATGEFTIYADKQIELTKVSLFANPDAANGIQIWPAQEQPVEINSMELYGTFPGLSWDKGLSMTKSESNPAIWSVTLTGVALEGIQYEYKVSANGVWGEYQLPADDSNQNWIFGTDMYPAGTYNLTFTADTENHVLSLTPEKVEQGNKDLVVTAKTFEIKAGETAELIISLENAMDITGWDMKLFTPSGITTTKKKCVLPEDGRYAMTEDEELTHELNFSKLTVDEGNGYYLACYSMANDVITGNSGVIVTISLTADANFDGKGEIIISDFGVADTNNKSILLGEDVVMPILEGVVGIEDVKAEAPVKPVMYNLQGQRINAPVKGIVIMNGKKMFVK